jgi:uncharacterized protein YutE (UPF0331/DUF86 family)
MDAGLIAEKLEALRRCVARVEEKRPLSADILAGDPDCQDIVAVNLQRAVQLCVDIAAYLLAESNEPPPMTMGETFDALAHMGVITPDLAVRLRKAVGFRNIAVHAYQRIDWAIVFSIAKNNLDDFREFARAVTRVPF